jgi:hypothetical protein
MIANSLQFISNSSHEFKFGTTLRLTIGYHTRSGVSFTQLFKYVLNRNQNSFLMRK